MATPLIQRSAVAVLLGSALLGCSSTPAGLDAIPLAELDDRIAGGWAGQMIGVSYGLPTEFRFNNQIIRRTGPARMDAPTASPAPSTTTTFTWT